MKPLAAGITALAARDVNRDSRTDLLGAPGLLLVNRPGGFEAATAASPRVTCSLILTAAAGYRMPTLPVTARSSSSTMLATNYGNWIEVALTGVKNLKSALGAKVEVKAGMLV